MQMSVSPRDRVGRREKHLPRRRQRESRTAAEIEKACLCDWIMVNPLIGPQACMKEVEIEVNAAVRVQALSSGEDR